MDMQFTEEKKRKKPRAPSEILDTPRRWLVRGVSGNYTATQDSKPSPGQAALMGTHEDQKHAEKRLGWSA